MSNEVLTFDAFFNMYPKAVNYAEAEAAWRKLNPSPAVQKEIRAALEWQARDWTKRDSQYIPSPASYLVKLRWKDKPMGWFKKTFGKQPVRQIDPRPPISEVYAYLRANPDKYRKGLELMGTLGPKVLSPAVIDEINRRKQEPLPSEPAVEDRCPW